jgi:hypothetical protein
MLKVPNYVLRHCLYLMDSFCLASKHSVNARATVYTAVNISPRTLYYCFKDMATKPDEGKKDSIKAAQLHAAKPGPFSNYSTAVNKHRY